MNNRTFYNQICAKFKIYEITIMFNKLSCYIRWSLFILPVIYACWITTTLIKTKYGMPVDDAYIYLTYITNLIHGNGYCFNTGEISFGCTSFLFPLFCAFIGTLTPWIDPLLIMQYCGVFWFCVLIIILQIYLYEHTTNIFLSCAGGLLVASCRPLYFTALSGLETSMFLAMAVIIFYFMMRNRSLNSVWLGCLTSILFLIRPEGLIVAVAYLFFLLYSIFLFRQPHLKSKTIRTVIESFYFGLGFLITAFPYLLFVKIHSGFWMPSTFYGKLLHLNHFTTFSWPSRIRRGFQVLIEAYQEIIVQDPTPFIFSIMLLLSFFSFLIFSYRCASRHFSDRVFAIRATMLLLFFFPFILGAKFHIYPQFGGYFLRYIQLLFVLFHIEAVFTLHYLIHQGCALIPVGNVRKLSIHIFSFLIAFVSVVTVYRSCIARIDADQIFYSNAVEFNENVRKKAGQWINQNTPATSRILVGTTGLGVVGLYCDRYVKDEGGLINPDIYPYLKQFSNGYSHWNSMMEYMKLQQLNYYTYYHQSVAPPITNRYIQYIDSIEGAWREDASTQGKSQISIFQFQSFEHYNLFEDFKSNLTVINEKGNILDFDRIRPTSWNNTPVLAVNVQEATFEIQFDMLFPDHALLKTGIAIDFPPINFDNEDTVQFNVFVDHEKPANRKTVFSKVFPLNQFKQRLLHTEIEIDLSQFNNRFRTMILAVKLSKTKQTGTIWAGWVNPRIINKELYD